MNFSTTKINRRNILAMSAAGSAGLLLGTRPLASLGAVAKDLSRVELRVARNRFFPANLSDLWERAGVGNFPYKIKYAEFLTTASAVEAMNADALDVGLASEPAAAFASASGAQVKLISSGRLDDNAQAILIPSGSPIKTISDLRGKRVCYVRAVSSHYILLKVLEKNNLSWSDVKPVPLSPADGQAAFLSGYVDAWVMYGHAIPFNVMTYGAKVLSYGKGYESGFQMTIANPLAIADPLRREALADYLIRVRHGYAWANANPREYAKLWSDISGVKYDVILRLVENASGPLEILPITPDAQSALQEVADTFTKAGELKSRANTLPIWDLTFDKVLKNPDTLQPVIKRS
ncbi:ABC transporter substrate-binding protein [Paraburkholderia nemoris]|uniref:ABC transporter substrate-binding protein n=1 Tax=Paraburkholderia nemoris TaxID=2793076 RepID=UPI0038B938F0